jgi:hypothetical protein
VTLLRATDGGPDTQLVVADWDDSAAYQRWVTDPWRTGNSAALAELLDRDDTAEADGPVIGRLYEPITFPQASSVTEEHS